MREDHHKSTLALQGTMRADPRKIRCTCSTLYLELRTPSCSSRQRRMTRRLITWTMELAQFINRVQHLRQHHRPTLTWIPAGLRRCRPTVREEATKEIWSTYTLTQAATYYRQL